MEEEFFQDDFREERDSLYLDILQPAVLLFFCPSNVNVSSETKKMSTLVITNIEAYQPNDTFEKAIIAVLSFFVDKKFKIEINIADLKSGLQPPPRIPNNWRAAIGTINVLGVERKIAGYYVQVHDQRFTLTFSYAVDNQEVGIILSHLIRHENLSTVFHAMEIDGIIGTNGYAYASNIVQKLGTKFKCLIEKAQMNLSPSAGVSTPK